MKIGEKKIYLTHHALFCKSDKFMFSPNKSVKKNLRKKTTVHPNHELLIFVSKSQKNRANQCKIIHDEKSKRSRTDISPHVFDPDRRPCFILSANVKLEMSQPPKQPKR